MDVLLSHPFLLLLPSLLLASLTLLIFYLVAIAPRRLSIWNVPGPTKLDSILWGDMGRLIDETTAGDGNEGFLQEYGHTMRMTTILGGSRIISSDPGFVNRVLKNSYIYPKNYMTSEFLSMIMSGKDGIIVAEGDAHRRMRRVLAPAFSADSTKRLTPIFLEKSYELRDRLLEVVRSTEKMENEEEGKGADVEIMVWLSRATLDIIGLAGFDYDFNSLQDSTNELQIAFKQMFEATNKLSPIMLLQVLVPWTRGLPTKSSIALALSKKTIERIGNEMVRVKKKAALKAAGDEGKEDVETNLLEGRDVLSQLVRANMASDLPASQRLSDKEVVAQISTVVLAGFETSSTAMTWLLYALANDPTVQAKLRAELLDVDDAMPDLDTLNSLPYLDAVVRETLRVYSPVPDTSRKCIQTDTVPLSKPIIGRDGREIKELIMEEGVTLVIPMLNINRSKEIWGEDAETFRPERWIDPVPPGAKDYEAVPWSSLMTFIAGARGCIGYRFSLAEIKSLTFVLVRSFDFAPIEPRVEYRSKASIVQRPRIVGREEEGYQMVLRIRALGKGEGAQV